MTAKVFIMSVVLLGAISSLAELKPVAIKATMSLKGSKEVARHQNSVADKEKLTRLANEKQLKWFIDHKKLVPLPDNLFIKVDPRLKEEHSRYVRPWTRDFLNDMGRSHWLRFPNHPLQINSAIRTIEGQKELRRKNLNAAPIAGPTQSSHSTGSTVDIAKLNLSEAEKEWLRDFLRQKKSSGQIEVAEEQRQSVFHVMVFRDYGKKKTVKASMLGKSKNAKAPPSTKKKSVIIIKKIEKKKTATRKPPASGGFLFLNRILFI